MHATLKTLMLGAALALSLTVARAEDTKLAVIVFPGVQNLPHVRRAGEGLLRQARPRGRT